MKNDARRYLRGTLACALVTLVLLAGCQVEDDIHKTDISIDTAPKQGATVSINGQVYGTSPLHVEGLPPGAVFIEATLDGFKRAHDTYKIAENSPSSFTITMQQLVGELNIESDPTNAMVYIDDGAPLGVTPLTGIRLPEGAHSLEIRHDKYEPLTETVEIRADYKYSKLFTLKPRESRLEVFSTPSSAAIYLNNRVQKEKTPARLPVQPGTYTVGVYKRGYIMGEEVVSVEPASDATVSLVLKEGAVPLGMVLIPGGEFIMGTDDKSPDERPRRSVFVESFYMDKYEVTNAEYKEVIQTHTYPKGQDEYPITNVTWEQAAEFARLVNKRLPTEAEWEKAARGTDGREYPWSNIWDPSLANVNTGGINQKAVPVGKFLGGASPYGCLDMAGNAYEWTSSWYAAYPGNTAIVKEYGQVFRVLRGGSYKTGPFEARCMTRRYDLMTNKRDDYGFRCAADVDEGPQGKAQ